MRGYIIRRLLLTIPVAVVVITIIFAVMHITPGDEVLASIEEGTNLSPEQIAKFRELLGSDRPIIVQYLDWFGGLFRGDLGTSLYTGRPASTQLGRAIPVTLELVIISQLIALVIAIPIGTISALKQDSWVDYILRVTSIGMLAAPSFWIATLTITIGAYYFFWAPPFGYYPFWEEPALNLKQFLLPAFVYGLHYSAVAMRMTRSTVLEVMRQDYVRTARAKGLGGKTVISRHVLKNSMIPVITIWGASVAHMMGGVVIIETVFGLPGVGLSMVQALRAQDAIQLQANMLFFAFAVTVTNLVVDISYSWFDPRVRYA